MPRTSTCVRPQRLRQSVGTLIIIYNLVCVCVCVCVCVYDYTDIIYIFTHIYYAPSPASCPGRRKGQQRRVGAPTRAHCRQPGSQSHSTPPTSRARSCRPVTDVTDHPRTHMSLDALRHTSVTSQPQRRVPEAASVSEAMCMFECMFVCMYVSVHVCTHSHTYIHSFIHTYIHI